ncbi:MAG TPA: prepilin-type N-terminal cleavage/methylation domain-containing protein [Armatimonadota bacterium]|nr:prepilin-type N-terminal cleavage/methylation domain-containing protein [Armatimonadota bacterium]
MNNRQRYPGFTLVEVMVAVVIFLIFVTAVYGVFRAANQAMAHAEDQEDVYQTGRVLLSQITAELTSAYQPASSQVSALVGEDSSSDNSDAMQADQLSFLTTAHPVPNGETGGDVCRVTYLMGGDQDNEKPGLYVEEDLHPGLEMTDEQPARRLLSPLVIGFNCKYLPVDEDWATEWVDQTTLPVAVRIELTLKPKRPGSKPVVMVTTVNITMATAPAGGSSE